MLCDVMRGDCIIKKRDCCSALSFVVDDQLKTKGLFITFFSNQLEQEQYRKISNKNYV